MRRAVVTELENTRSEMNALVAELASARDDAEALAKRLFRRDTVIEELKQDLQKAQEEAASSRGVVAAQQRHIDRLKAQLRRPVRQLAKKALGRGNG